MRAPVGTLLRNDELRERATRLAVDARRDPAGGISRRADGSPG
ncbi:hypothetical protein [Micromonospora sp. NBC_01813]|nr:hypothetical protein [Micromonospora sp. NBC_01813]WSA10208.1 hypothetical protein OG958_05270 [Micromonospora sp. NBC_01813]